MRLEFAIRASEIENTRRTIETLPKEVRVDYSNVLIGNIFMSEMQDGGPSLFLGNIPLLEFFYTFHDFLYYDMRNPGSESQLADINQTFEINAKRIGENLLISLPRSETPRSIIVNYVKAKKQSERVPVAFLGDMFQFYPKFRYHAVVEGYQHRFGVV